MSGIQSTTVAPKPATEAPQREPLLYVHVPSKSAEGGDRFQADWSYDLVVRHGDILDARGLTVGDMTSGLVQALRAGR